MVEYKKVPLHIPTKSGVEYSIDTNGVITNETRGRVVGGRIKNGYHLICVSSVWKPVHRYVAETFIPNPEGKRFVNHKNGIKSDNRVENLEWCTHAENMRHARDTGLWKPHKGEAHGMAKLTEAQVHRVCQHLSEGGSFGDTKSWGIKALTKSVFFAIKYRRNWKHISKLYDF